MQMKNVNSMLRDGRIDDLANYIKSGQSVKDMCFIHVAAKLQVQGISEAHLVNQQAIVTLPKLLEKVQLVSLEACKDEESRSLLKHYRLVLSNIKTLWKDNRLESTSELAKALDKKSVDYLLDMWRNHLVNGYFQGNAYIAHVEKFVSDRVSLLTKSLLDGRKASLITEDQFNHSKNVLINIILTKWQKNVFPECNLLGTYLSSAIIKVMVDGAMNDKLGEVMQNLISEKLAEAFKIHINRGDIKEKFPQLDKTLDTAIEVVLKRHPTDKLGNHKDEIINELIKNYKNLGNSANDIRKILENEVMPEIMLNLDMPDAKRTAVETLVREFHERKLSAEIGKYITTLIEYDVSADVRRAICNNQAFGLFNGLIENHVQNDVSQYKLGGHVIRNILANVEFFSDIQSSSDVIKAKLDSKGEDMSILVQRIQRLENMVEVLSAKKDQNVAVLEQKLLDLQSMFEAFLVLQQAPQPSAPSLPAVQTAQSNGSLFGFFGKSAGEPESKGDGPKPGK